MVQPTAQVHIPTSVIQEMNTTESKRRSNAKPSTKPYLLIQCVCKKTFDNWRSLFSHLAAQLEYIPVDREALRKLPKLIAMLKVIPR
ncbi:MAG: hypothetical protein WED05_10080 [Candidatus Atabeyarchaeum deiterrae]